MKTEEGIKKYCSILSSFSTGIASSAGKFTLSLPSTHSSTLPFSNPSLTVSHSTITSSSAYSTGLFHLQHQDPKPVHIALLCYLDRPACKLQGCVPHAAASMSTFVAFRLYFQINHRIDTCHFNVFSRILKENLHYCNLKSF
ncbi:unnamed protein product, partial [Brassica oleracea var. botrytis]